VEDARRAALVEAAIREIGAAGSLEVTMARVAGAAGVSAPLAHHYFGGKDALFEAAMRAILADYASSVRAAIDGASDPRARVEAVLAASFSDAHFAPHVVAAWLVFYVQAQRRPAFRRLLQVYHARLRSNLLAGLRPLAGEGAEAAADSLGAMIDGLYLRAALSDRPATGADALATVRAHLDMLLAQAPS
jgi:TetR/AcrR family transcriptional repressor of bet genes